MNQYKIAISKVYEETETRTIVYHRVIKLSEFPMGLQPRSLEYSRGYSLLQRKTWWANNEVNSRQV